MLSLNELNIIKETVTEFFRKMTIDIDIRYGGQKEEIIPIDIITEEPQLLIGEKGQTLSEIQHLLKSMLRRKIETPFYIDLDINDYKKKKMEYLKEMARSAADEVAINKTEKELPPMPPYERRIIHMEIAERTDVKTESVGEEPERRIVISPK